MNFAKRMLALALAVVMVFTLAACSGSNASKDAATCGESGVSGALFTRFMLDAYSLAESYKDDPEADLFSTTVEGVPASEWIANTTRDDVRRYFAVEQKFNETDMEFTDEDQAAVDSYAASMMETYSYLFGPNEVDLQALKDYYTYNIKSMALFDYYYAEGGEKAVPAEELKQTMLETYNLTKLMIFDKALPTTDADGNLVEPTADEQAAAEAKARGYYDRALAGESFEELIIEWEGEYFTPEELGHTHEADGSHDLVTVIGSSDVPKEYAAVMDSAPFEVPQFIEDDDVYYVAVRYNIVENTATYENYRPTVLLNMRSSDYKDMVDEWLKDMDITFNETVLSKLTAEKIAENMGTKVN